MLCLYQADGAIARIGTAEDTGHGRVFTLADRVVFVIVAAGACHRQAQKRLGGGIELFIGHVHGELCGVAFIQCLRAHSQKTGGYAVGIFGGFAGGRQQVSRQLARDEIRQRHIGIQGIDNPVAVPPSVWITKIDLLACGFGKPRHIEPMPAPRFPKVRAGQQAIHGCAVCLFRWIFEECHNFLTAGWQPCQVEIKAPEQLFWPSIGYWMNPCGFLSCSHKTVEIRLGPSGIRRHGDFW